MALVKVRNDADDAWIEIGGQVSITQSDSEPDSTYPGMLWLDTDAPDVGGIPTLIEDDDQDTMVQVEESGDEDIVRIDAGGNEIWKGLATGEITAPLQPAFLVELDGTQTNMPKNSVLEFDFPIFDIGSNYDTDLYRFTAPVTGKYFLAFHARLDQLDQTYDNVYIRIDTSNRNYYVYMDPDIFDRDPPYWTWTLAIVADMDEDDFVYCAFSWAGGGAEQTDLVGGGSYTHFMGHLLS